MLEIGGIFVPDQSLMNGLLLQQHIVLINQTINLILKKLLSYQAYLAPCTNGKMRIFEHISEVSKNMELDIVAILQFF